MLLFQEKGVYELLFEVYGIATQANPQLTLRATGSFPPSPQLWKPSVMFATQQQLQANNFHESWGGMGNFLLNFSEGEALCSG